MAMLLLRRSLAHAVQARRLASAPPRECAFGCVRHFADSSGADESTLKAIIKCGQYSCTSAFPLSAVPNCCVCCKQSSLDGPSDKLLTRRSVFRGKGRPDKGEDASNDALVPASPENVWREARSWLLNEHKEHLPYTPYLSLARLKSSRERNGFAVSSLPCLQVAIQAYNTSAT